MAHKRKQDEVSDAAESAAPEVAGPESEAAATTEHDFPASKSEFVAQFANSAQVAAMLSVLRQHGYQTNEAETVLRSMLAHMSGGGDTNDAWNAVGTSMFDADGNPRPLDDVFRSIGVGLDGMTEDQQGEVFYELGGVYGREALRYLVYSTSIDLPEIPESDDDLLGNGELVIHENAPDGVIGDVQVIDVRTDDFITLRFRKANWPVGLRLGTMPREAVRAVSGELGGDAQGLIAWFLRLPGEVKFRDGSRVVLRDDPEDGYKVEVR